ncbi:MAG: isoleucine--tRNA ligase, partial [Candidatus Thermoplasmatota archaeon]|nr:isoleucine--tRNA ligase [Candidatus Thermoplasmatota archaeon]
NSGAMVRPNPAGELDAVALETALLETWKNEQTFQQSIDSNRTGAPFIFLEGPPTANGKPGIHHVVARAYKDLVCRWKTMEGFLVERKGGWDTHGLPVEIEVQKRLDLMSNEAIEEFGMQAFNDACRESVWTYESAWREMTERMAYWVDLDNPYVTLHNDYVESCWWALKQMFDKDLLYRGHKVLPYCPQTGTSYSSHEVALGYKEVEEPSVYVKFKLIDDSASILAWTTTPWTLPGNVGLAVGPNVTYARCRVREEPEGWQGRGGASVGEELILAKDLMGEVLRHHVDIIEEIPGSSLVGKSYEPLFPDAVPRGDSTTAWTVLSADWVTTTDGTGVVHTAVMYGEDDYNLGMEVGLPAYHTVSMEGNFVAGVHPELDGRYVKSCDDSVMDILVDQNDSIASGLLYREKSYLHDYPHCWRTDHPLLYYAMDSWFVRMTAVKERLLEFNNDVEWAPDWVGEGRFGEWLRNVKDWAISRERYWGTPLPVWRDEDGNMKCVGSIAELQAEVAKANAAGFENPECPDDVDLHRPVVDAFTLVSDDGKPMHREPFVMDCWFDSGCAPFAQWHHPFDENKTFDTSFPVDYICEGVDQTRGWFYTLLAVSTTVFDSPAYKRCLSLGLILDAEGKKMSKSRGNIVDPWDHFNREGADATRWYMVTAGAPWNPLKFDSNGVRETYAKMFLTFWNVYRFHADYAALDAFDPASSTSAYESRSRLDRWILSKLHSTAKAYHDGFTNWNFHKACRELEDFIVNDLSNWYVRRSRRRLWDEAESGDKLACQHTLHEILVTLCRLIAPVSPFMVDTIHRNLTGETVHTAAWPLGTPGSTEDATADAWNEDLVAATQQLPPHDAELEHEMALVRELAETGRRIRIDAQRRQRLPCAEGWIVAGPNLEAYHDLLCEELNVESISVETDLDRFQQVELGVNFRALAPRAKGDVNAIANQIKNHSDQDGLLADIRNGSCTIMGVDILESDVEVRRAEREGYAAATITVGEGDDASHVSLVLDMQDTPHLLSKGLARDITRRIQSKRKDMDLEIEAMIDVEVWMADAPELFEEDQAWVAKETRASGIAFSEDQAPADVESFDVDGARLSYRVKKV